MSLPAIDTRKQSSPDESWQVELWELATRYPETGIYLDLPNMSDADRFRSLTWLRCYGEGRE